MQEEMNSTTRTQSNKSNGKWKAQAQGQAADKDRTSEHLDEAQSQIFDSAKKAYDTVVEKASEMFKGINASPTTYIRQYPVQAAIGGAVAGFLLGAAVCRRSVTK